MLRSVLIFAGYVIFRSRRFSSLEVYESPGFSRGRFRSKIFLRTDTIYQVTPMEGCFLLSSLFYFPVQLVTGFTPKQPSRQAVVTGHPFSRPVLHVNSCLSREGFTIPVFNFSLCSSIFIEFRQLALLHFSACQFHKKRSLTGFEPTTSTSIVTRLMSEPPGMPAAVVV